MKENGQYYVLSSDKKRTGRKGQDEHKEYLLCAKCDNEILGGYERHLSDLLFTGNNLRFSKNQASVTINGLDYTKAKCGCLSILWRMHHSRNEMFDQVHLGEKHENRIREIVLNGLCVEEEEYPISLVAPVYRNEFIGSCIIPPDSVFSRGNRIYRILISGLIFTFVVGSKKETSDFLISNLKKDGSWVLFRLELKELPFLFSYFKELKKHA